MATMTRDEARAEATKILEANPDAAAMRSCWNCNDMHEHLKNAAYVIVCFSCGHTFYKGVQLTDDPEPTDVET